MEAHRDELERAQADIHANRFHNLGVDSRPRKIIPGRLPREHRVLPGRRRTMGGSTQRRPGSSASRSPFRQFYITSGSTRNERKSYLGHSFRALSAPRENENYGSRSEDLDHAKADIHSDRFHNLGVDSKRTKIILGTLPPKH